ncbi:hypothetical protein EDD21DRAFT_415799 [Dissophora ornata]|nr:hypothetical protein EDD21DRAFT_415799 [Dissophora ornata]
MHPGHGNTYEILPQEHYSHTTITKYKYQLRKPPDAEIIRSCGHALFSAWNDVTQTSIRNCYAHVRHCNNRNARRAFEDEEDHEMEQLKQGTDGSCTRVVQAPFNGRRTLAYSHNSRAARARALHKGLMDAIKNVSADVKFKCFFLSAGSVVLVDEDAEDDGVDSPDSGYSLENQDDRIPIVRRIMERRSGPHETELPPDVCALLRNRAFS